ncbi:tyrosine-type recombinase/integrase [Streptomyces sp. NPDC087440]|uniref:tyrosine-type recombinase/integrase n=1 Tax=Streptomyces sp. NPDC087440 TaxID=3365790 RepID=UPI00382DF8C6
MSHPAPEPADEIVDAELVDDAELALVSPPSVRLRVTTHTVLRPGQALPTDDDAPRYSTRDLYVSPETAAAMTGTDAEPPPMAAFRTWCAEEGRVAVPCTTATFTDYGHSLMRRGLKISTIRNYMSLIRTTMPPGERPDNSLFLELLADYRRTNKRAVRTKRAFPLTIAYTRALCARAEQDGRPIGVRDAALFAFSYRFLARSDENVNLDIEDLTVLDDRIEVWLAKDKTHQNEDQNLVLMDRSDLRMVPRMRAWLAHLAACGVTGGPLFIHLMKNGLPASGFRESVATERGAYLRPKTVDERLKFWWARAGLVSDGRPVSSQGFRAGAATDLAEHGADGKTIAKAGRWNENSTIPDRVYVRPAKAANHDPFDVIPLHP